MIALIQRVREASVSVDGAEVGRIGSGLLALIGIEKGDGEAEAKRLVERVMHYRVFADAAGRMNRSLIDVDGALLAVSQFTLVADTQSGTRPGFSRGATPDNLVFLPVGGRKADRSVTMDSSPAEVCPACGDLSLRQHGGQSVCDQCGHTDQAPDAGAV
jgi:D-tyrosyl-tRNA(Tyr) deacylase